MATMDHLFSELQISKFNFNGLIMQLEQTFRKTLLFSVCSYLKLMFKNNFLHPGFDVYGTYTERRSASENCIIDNTDCIVFSFQINIRKMLL